MPTATSPATLEVGTYVRIHDGAATCTPVLAAAVADVLAELGASESERARWQQRLLAMARARVRMEER